MITIVSGLPRSGTSMMMQMLEAGGMEVLTDGIREADENNRRGYYEYEPVKSLRSNNTWMAEAEGKAVKVIAQLLPNLPASFEYRILFMERTMDEILRSQQNMLANLGRGGPRVDPAILAHTFEQQVNRVKATLAQHANVGVLYVAHRAVIEDPAAQAAAVNAFLGGILDAQAMAGVVDPALYRQRI